MKTLTILGLSLALQLSSAGSIPNNKTETRDKRIFSLFSVVQFPNDVCTTSQGATIFGTCLASSECTTAGGTASGNCAAGFGVCCYVATSTCASTISRNNTYIQNPNYPSSYTATASTTCTYTIGKVSDDVCQLRLDFQTFSGFAVTTATGICSDSFAIVGQTGKNPPSICGTNTGYHMYVEVGAATGDTATATFTYAAATPNKQFNIFVQQIECDSVSRAPTDCVQYFTGQGNTVNSYNFAGGQLLEGMEMKYCIRTERGYCSINWKETAGTTIDAFGLYASAIYTAAISAALSFAQSAICVAIGSIGIILPQTSYDGIQPLMVGPANVRDPFPTAFCGGVFGVDTDSIPRTLTSVQMPFGLYLFTLPAGTMDTAVVSPGFSLDYTQNAC